MGLSDATFEVIRKSNDKFYCYQCFVTSHGKQIKELQDSIALLMREVKTLKAQMSKASDTGVLDMPVDWPSYSGAVKTGVAT